MNTKPCTLRCSRSAQNIRTALHGWVITTGHNACEDDVTHATDTQVRNLRKHGFTSFFQMYDGDDILCYSGYAKDDSAGIDFEPLDKFGGPNAGCTEIYYRNPNTAAMERL